jgi:acetyltransferase-like isoleucine patch superfamily enzyme
MATLPTWVGNAVSTVAEVALEPVLGERAAISANRIRGFFQEKRWNAKRIRLGRNVRFVGIQKIKLGNNVSIGDGVLLSAWGRYGEIVVGEGTHIDCYTVLYGHGGLRIGEGCAISGGTLFYSQTSGFKEGSTETIDTFGTKYSSVRVGDDVWIGAGAIILPGVAIESHAVVGAGAVVTRNVPEWAVVAGVPARIIRDRRDVRP